MFILFAWVSLFLLSCTKDIYDSFEVKTLSVNQVGEDSVQVEGIVTDNGNFGIEYRGFCMSTLPVPKMMDNQILLNGDIGKYKAEYLYLEPNTEYYFRSFAANEVGYVYGNIIKYQVPFSNPPVVPCTLVDNKIVDNGYNYSVSYADTNGTPQHGGNFKVSIDCSLSANKMYYLEFMQTPRNGIYTTSDINSFTNDKKNVFVNIFTGFNYFYINPNGKVYVSVDSVSKKMSISFCDLTYLGFSTNFPLKGKVIIN